MPLSLNADSFKNADSVAQQLNNSFSGAQSTVSASVAGLQSTGSSLTGALSDIGSKLGDAGQSILSAGKAALDQLGSFTTVTKFADALGNPASLLSPSPESTRGATTTPPGVLKYPSDLGNYYISFKFQQYFKDSPLAPKVNRETVTILLPMPSDLVDKFNATYSNKDLGVTGKLMQQAGLFDKVAQGDFSEQSFKEVGKGLGKQVTPQTGAALARTALGDTGIGAGIDRATGTVLNPFTALQFQSVGLRKHSFKFKLSPNSREEAIAVQKIIRTFKERMLPAKNGLLFLFPDTCVINFATPNVPYSMKTCFLESMSVNYAPNGVPSFFKGSEFMSEVEISLEFGETEPVTRDDILNKNGDITGDGKPFTSMDNDSSIGSVLTEGAKSSDVPPIPRTNNDQGVAGLQGDDGSSYGAGGLSG